MREQVDVSRETAAWTGEVVPEVLVSIDYPRQEADWWSRRFFVDTSV